MNIIRFKDISGNQYGWLTVLSRTTNTNKGTSQWLCQCACGKKTTMRIDILKKSKTCGRCNDPTIHKAAYSSWTNAKSRCNNPNDPKYKDYGGRGIKMCKEWEDDFRVFLNDMGDPPFDSLYKENYSIERKDNDKGYNKENCIWADRLTQAANRRTNIIVFPNVISS